jgi:hypothetical protein
MHIPAFNKSFPLRLLTGVGQLAAHHLRYVAPVRAASPRGSMAQHTGANLAGL